MRASSGVGGATGPVTVETQPVSYPPGSEYKNELLRFHIYVFCDIGSPTSPAYASGDDRGDLDDWAPQPTIGARSY